MSEEAAIYDEESVSFLQDIAPWIQKISKSQKIDYATDLKANLLPTILRMFEILSARLTEHDNVLMEQLEENTLQQDFAAAILNVFALAEEAISAALVPSDNEAVKKFRAAVAEITPQIHEAVIEKDDDEEEEEEETGDAAEEETVA